MRRQKKRSSRQNKLMNQLLKHMYVNDGIMKLATLGDAVQNIINMYHGKVSQVEEGKLRGKNRRSQ